MNWEVHLIESTKSLFREASSSYMVDYSPVALSLNTPEKKLSRSLGVFATRDICFAERSVQDTTIIVMSTVSVAAPSTLMSTPDSSPICDNCYGRIPTQWRQRVSSQCCDTPHFSARCRDIAIGSYHKVL